MFSYNNPEFEPQINDFEDDYNLPDAEEAVSGSLLEKVKQIRRRYANWFEYVDACQLYDQYMEDLIDKYGGKNNFKLALLLKQVREFIPNYPELRKTKKNRYYVKHRVSRPLVVSEPSFEKNSIEELNNIKEPKVKIRIVESDRVEQIYRSRSGMRSSSDVTEAIANELDVLSSWYASRRDKIARMKGKKKKKEKLMRVLNQKQLKMNSTYRSLGDMIRIYDKNKVDKFMNRTKGYDLTIEYKGRMISQSQVEQTNTLEKLRDIGVRFNHISRLQTKLIRKRKASKKMRKKNKKLEKNFMEAFCHDEYNDFVDFENEIMELTGSRRFD